VAEVEGAAHVVRVTLNGDPVELDEGTTLAEVVRRVCPSDRGIAVALDREVVSRSRWDVVVVCDGDRVEIVTAAAGG
jgi:sulfur carrier protein